jgi:hypothetical protein
MTLFRALLRHDRREGERRQREALKSQTPATYTSEDARDSEDSSSSPLMILFFFGAVLGVLVILSRSR